MSWLEKNGEKLNCANPKHEIVATIKALTLPEVLKIEFEVALEHLPFSGLDKAGSPFQDFIPFD